MNQDLKRLPNEDNDQYFYRVCSMKDALGFTWPQMAEIFNNEFGNDCGESKYRKDWAAFERIFTANEDRLIGDAKYLDEIKNEIERLLKVKKQVSDQRREYNKLVASDARADNLAEKLIEVARSLPLNNYNTYFEEDYDCEEQEAVLFLTDWHYGMTTDNIWNTYNIDICKERIRLLYEKVLNILLNHKVSKLHVVILGDLVHGGIHNSARVASEENVCEQLMHVSEILANFINELSAHVNGLDVHSTYGNHARTIQDKKDSIHADNMEKIIPWWLRQRLKDNNKINVIDSEYYEFIYLEVCGYNIVCTHGDLDSNLKNIGVTVNTLFSKKFGKTIDYTFNGDKHHLEAFEQFDIESTLVGSLCGSDEYANNRRLYSNPMQTLCIFTPDDGKQCTYNIKL